MTKYLFSRRVGKYTVTEVERSIFNPGPDALQFEETDEKATEKLWVDMSERRYTISDSPIELDEKIQHLVDKAKIFEPSDDMVVKKIFYHNAVGVIIYARNDKFDKAIYFAKKTNEEFMITDAKKISQCRCLQGDSTWEVKLPEDTDTHKFSFAQGPHEDGHKFETTWNGINLKKIVV